MELSDDDVAPDRLLARRNTFVTSPNGNIHHPNLRSIANGFNEPAVGPTAVDRRGSMDSPIELDVTTDEVERNLPAEVWQMLSLEAPSSTESETEATDEIADSLRLQERRDRVKPLRSGLVYDVRMRYHSELAMAVKNQDYHPEDPRRIFHIYRELCKSGLVEDTSITTEPLVEHPLKKINITAATKEEICLVHDVKHFDFMESIQCNAPF